MATGAGAFDDSSWWMRRANTVVGRWVEMAPGDDAGALGTVAMAAGAFGDGAVAADGCGGGATGRCDPTTTMMAGALGDGGDGGRCIRRRRGGSSRRWPVFGCVNAVAPHTM